MKNTAAWWAMGVALVAIAAHFIASPSVALAKGEPGFITETFIQCYGSVDQSEEYYWSYTGGEGNFSAVTSGTDDQGHAIIVTPGFQEEVTLVYEQDYSARNGSTYFWKTLALDPNQMPNLHVRTSVSFQGDPAASSSLAGYNERVGLAVMSTGGDNTASSQGSSLLTLCPWASSSNTESGGGYPATSEILAAGSSFVVTDILGFFSEATAISAGRTFFGYSVETLPGRGSIRVGFSAEVWEATGKWGTHDIGIHENPATTTGIFAINDPPQRASHASYSDQATADGVWTLTKKAWYQNSLPKTNLLIEVP